MPREAIPLCSTRDPQSRLPSPVSRASWNEESGNSVPPWDAVIQTTHTIPMEAESFTDGALQEPTPAATMSHTPEYKVLDLSVNWGTRFTVVDTPPPGPAEAESATVPGALLVPTVNAEGTNRLWIA
jgi:hypothetical protein